MDFTKLLQERYTTKYYDSSKDISDNVIAKIVESMRLSPSSVNLQPWKIMVFNRKSKELIRPAIKDFNLQRFDGASHVIVILNYTKVSDDYYKMIIDKEDQDGRFPTTEIKTEQHAFKKGAGDDHVNKQDFAQWTAKQCYILLGTALYAACDLGVDSTPVEGLDYAKMNEILDLKAKNLDCQSVVFLGYRSKEDSNTLDKRPKSRKSTEYFAEFVK